MSSQLQISPLEYEWTAIRASGPGGQHVNKVASAIQLHFNVHNSSLTAEQKQMILQYPDKRIGKEGIIVIRAETHRSRLKNLEEAVYKLHQLVRQATQKRKKRIATRPSRSDVENRLQSKSKRSEKKEGRRPVDW